MKKSHPSEMGKNAASIYHQKAGHGFFHVLLLFFHTLWIPICYGNKAGFEG
ncbi:hypothetical protein M3699_01160 [Peribacillus simplex]|uniref:hypothetical protein n=1 Tax=Peribacillus simplex TaxID=1478 RepID=UPI00203DD4BC|nr:hypothetical protein [Peribacillus simplex]MCM3672514.1 hypothetical protein [Peribacillus simplex]